MTENSGVLEALLAAIRTTAATLLGVDPDGWPVLQAPAAERFASLGDAFTLTSLERAVVLCLFAAEYDPVMRLVARTVQGVGAAGLEAGTIAELLRAPLADAPLIAEALAPDSTLHLDGLIALEGERGPAVMTRARLDRRVARYLLGDDRASDGVDVIAPDAPPPRVDVPRGFDEVVTRVQRASACGGRALVEIAGAPGTGKRALAQLIARALGTPLVIVDARRGELESLLRDGLREARLRGGLLCVARFDAAFAAAAPARSDHDAPVARPRLPAPLARPDLARTGVLLLTTATSHAGLLRETCPTVLTLDSPFPNGRARARILAAELNLLGVDADAAPLESLARRFALDPRRLCAAAAEACAAADARDETVGTEHLARACRVQLQHELDGLADRVTVQHRLENLVVSPEIGETLQELIAHVRNGHIVHDDWGFARHHGLTEGVSALFAGPPGTGKTMCAQVIANELDLELFRVDLSRVVSKWVGETEKNLARVFDEAERSAAIVLFDEADSLFAKRTGVKSASDRYANLEVNFLLQRVEQFRGISILTTNHEDAIDAAFKRRLTFRVRFEKPNVEERTEMWRRAFPPTAAVADDVDPRVLAEIAELSGACIRNAAVRAAFLAAAARRPIDLAACVTATLREATEMGLVTHVSRAPACVAADDDEPAPVLRRPIASSRTIAITHPRRVAVGA